MPDAVLCHILSFLPTKDCVTTSTLSRRWRHIWKDLQVLDFCQNSCQGFEHLAVLVNRVLALRKGYDIRGFRLSCLYSDRDSSSVAKWVQIAIGPNLEELRLELHSNAGFRSMPHTLFTCSKLVSLSLSYGIHIEKPAAVCLPSLKMLNLCHINVDFYETLLSGCPALETLTLSICAKCLTKVHVPPSLKRLEFQVFSSQWESYLDIDVPGLEYLSIVHATSSFHCKFTNLQHVVDAFLDVGGVEKASVNTFHKLIRALCGTKSLKLGYFSTKMLLCPYFRFSEFSPFTSSGDHFSMFQLKFSEKCHVLQVLTISNWEEQKPLHLQSWAQPTRVPNCLRSHLTSFEFDGYRGLEDELEFAKYILRYGFVLKAMNISSHRSLDLSEKRDIHRHSLYDIRPGSSVCRFYFF
ncbi:F-box/LRR-repeat protein At3g26922-like [Gastrolobium bilobum]|uniref:F-box/LRR-repeat protein At3g26922-like n=1 Tax=Gastrolobium bilobum TaxID=150636 RepID=UPI002AB042EA|nr:F-box/LRR-repeat protein At3g26922-like [Gastrolobium bilobum]